MAARQQALDGATDVQLIPKAAEDQGRSDALAADGGHVTPPMSGKDHAGLGEFRAALQQAVELAIALQFIKPPDSGDDTLPTSAFFPMVLDDLEKKRRAPKHGCPPDPTKGRTEQHMADAP